MANKKFIALFDLHYGYERDRFRHKKPLHDEASMSIVLQFMKDFKPDEIILGGDMLDCGPLSSHRKREGAGRTEGLRLSVDAKELKENFLEKIERAHPRANKYYITGNHENWLNTYVDQEPGLDGLLDLNTILNLQNKWKLIPQGGYITLGKLTFIHGDQIKGGEYAAKKAVLEYEGCVRMGHFHTYQVYTKTSSHSVNQAKTGILVPCLSTTSPAWVRGASNRWVQGFNFGYINSDGSFTDYIPLIVKGKTNIHGKEYKGA